MKIEAPYQCDVCKAHKGIGNKWLIGVPVVSDGSGSGLAGLSLGESGSDHPTWMAVGYAIMAWDESTADDSKWNVHHFCSEAHALQKQQEYLRSETSTPAPDAAPGEKSFLRPAFTIATDEAAE